MDYRMANRSDIELFLSNRIEFVTSIREIENITEFENKTREYLNAHIEKDDLIIFLAMKDGNIAASCMACIYETAPLPGCLSGKAAQLLNVYTQTEFRRKGHATTLLNLLIEEIKKRDVKKIILDYTNDGYMLYQKLGFTRLEHQMMLKV